VIPLGPSDPHRLCRRYGNFAESEIGFPGLLEGSTVPAVANLPLSCPPSFLKSLISSDQGELNGFLACASCTTLTPAIFPVSG
jgi:hypothetical protein